MTNKKQIYTGKSVLISRKKLLKRLGIKDKNISSIDYYDVKGNGTRYLEIIKIKKGG